MNSALTKGASIQCPACGVQAIKDDACIHMDQCPCQASWCFLCGRNSHKETAPGPCPDGHCPRGPGKGGCDSESYYLEAHAGWADFKLIGENPAQGAQQEFIRRRQAYYVRQVMEQTVAPLWAQLQQKSPGLLTDCPTPGRKIAWDEVASAEFPLFGQTQLVELNTSEIPTDAAAAARFDKCVSYFEESSSFPIEEC